MLQDMKGAEALGLHSHVVKITFQYSLDTTLNIFANYIFMSDALKLQRTYFFPDMITPDEKRILKIRLSERDLTDSVKTIKYII